MEINDLPNGNTHYVDNKRFQELLVNRREVYDAEGKPPPVSDELGEMILKISENLSYRRNFINYSFREEMIGDGIETCLKYIDNYDPVNYKNPFAYFTQLCYYAFVRRITREDRQVQIRGKVYDHQSIDNEFDDKWEFQHAVVDDLMRGQPEIVE